MTTAVSIRQSDTNTDPAPPLDRPNSATPIIGDVCHPRLISGGGCEFPIQQVVRHRLVVVTVRGQHKSLLPLYYQPQFFHQFAKSIRTIFKAFFAQLLHQLAASQALPGFRKKGFSFGDTGARADCR